MRHHQYWGTAPLERTVQRYRFITAAERHRRQTAENGRLRICAGLLPAPTIGCPDWAYRDNLLTTPAERIGLSGPAAVGRRSAQRARTSIALNVAQHSARSHERHSGGLFPNQLKSTLSRVRGPCGDMCRWPPPVIFPGAQSERDTGRAALGTPLTAPTPQSLPRLALTCRSSSARPLLVSDVACPSGPPPSFRSSSTCTQ